MLPWLPGFPPQAFPTTIPSLTSPLSISPQSPTTITLGLLHNPYTPAPSRCTFQGTSIPVWGMYGSGKDCLILIPFTLPQISCFTLSLKCFSSRSDNSQMWGLDPCFSSSTVRGQVLLTLLFSPLVPLSYRVLHGSIYIFFLLSGTRSALRWCSACTSVSEGVFLMYL